MLSGIQHFSFCKRQWALIQIEMQWEENLHTVEGNIMHKRAHEGPFLESRGNTLISRGMAIHSELMGINGVCDVVEFKRYVKNPGTHICLSGREGFYKVIPVEYKKGESKAIDADRLQMAAQAMCLEEMMFTEIIEGFLFYGKTKRRERVEIDETLRRKVKSCFLEMHDFYSKKYTPKVKMTKACNACSLKEICLPKLTKKKSVREFIEGKLEDKEI